MAVSAARNQQLRRYVENRHIDHIPAAARHGKPWHQFAFWWGGNVNVFNVVLGAVVVSIGLTFWWALIAIAAGTLIGALLIALHATQGPKLGVPQSIQSRGQFGFYGSAFLFPAVLLLNLGFIAAELVIQAQALNGVTAVLTIPQWIVILVVPSAVIGIFGYRWIHWAMQATAVVVGVSLIIMFIQGLRHGALPAHETTLVRPAAGLFLAGVALLVIDMLSFGPFVSDYTRYLPTATSGPRLFWAIYAGNVLATFGSCAVGAYLAALLPSLGPVAAIGAVSGKWALIVMALSLVNANTFNAYTVPRTENCPVYCISVRIPAARRIAVMRSEMLARSSPVMVSRRLTGLPSARLAASRKIRCSPPEQGRSRTSSAAMMSCQSMVAMSGSP
jgi:NCS1 family nucleobase:cation symporter-1